jgi:hypothetical protein
MRLRSSEIRQEQIEWRQQKVLELAADGHTVREIESILKIPRATVGRDIVTLRQQAKDDIRKYITEQVPFEYKKTLVASKWERIWVISDNKSCLCLMNHIVTG